MLGGDARPAEFDRAVLPHLGAAFNLARWLTRSDHDAEDVVQEACLRAYRLFAGFRGADGRAWLLGIVRNTCYTWLARNRPPEPTTPFEDERHGDPTDAGPDAHLLRQEDRRAVREAVEGLPVDLREVIVLRELEGLSYKEIAGVIDVPLGTVMSRLARARERLQRCLAGRGDVP